MFLGVPTPALPFPEPAAVQKELGHGQKSRHLQKQMATKFLHLLQGTWSPFSAVGHEGLEPPTKCLKGVYAFQQSTWSQICHSRPSASSPTTKFAPENS